MTQLRSVWDALDTRRRAIAVLASVAMFAAIIGLGRLASAPSMALLYSGLDAAAAGEVVAALDQRGVAHQVRGGAIYVDGSRRDALRMVLASEGLPGNGPAGYELLDSLSGFGTTSQMFDAAYWRAKEGELARTIQASPHVKSARVHIARANATPFRRDLAPSASVQIVARAGALPKGQAEAIRYLVASAVPGLTGDAVTVVDADGGVVAGGEDGALTGGLERAEALRLKVQRLLDARVGPGNAVVEVSTETVTEREVISERRLDPQGRVAISTDTEESANSAQSAKGGGVTVASNLPDGDAGAGEERRNDSKTRERVNYEVSETQREVQRLPGAIKRLTVAVLVNAPDPAAGAPVDLDALRELVEAAVGFDAARGDVLSLHAMPFEPVVALGTAPAAGVFDSLGLDRMQLVQVGLLALVALVLGLFVVRPVLTRPPPPALPALAAAPVAGDALVGEIDEDERDVAAMALVPGSERQEASAPPDAPALPEADPVDRLRALIGERQEETVEILRTWMEEREERA